MHDIMCMYVLDRLHDPLPTSSLFICMPRTHQTCCICNKTIKTRADSHTITSASIERIQPHVSNDLEVGKDCAHHTCYNHPARYVAKQVLAPVWDAWASQHACNTRPATKPMHVRTSQTGATHTYACMYGWMDAWMYGCMLCMYVCMYAMHERSDTIIGTRR